MDLADMEKLFEAKLQIIEVKLTNINNRIDNQVKVLYFIVGGLIFPLILLAITILWSQ